MTTLTNQEIGTFALKLSEIIRYARKIANITQDELASSIGVSKTYISYLENGDRVPSIATLLGIAKATGLNLQITFALKE